MSSHNAKFNANPVELTSPTPLPAVIMGSVIVTDHSVSSANALAARGGESGQARPPRPALDRAISTISRIATPAPPASAPPMGGQQGQDMVLELADGTSYTGVSFGAEGKSVSGECVFQTGEYKKWDDCGKRKRRDFHVQ